MSTKTADWSGHTLEGRNGRYCIKSALGSGGMATVYLATDSRNGKEVAIKLPHEQILREEGFAARFTREIKSLLKLAHPNVVKVIDVGEFNKAPFAVLQYLALGSLRSQQPLDLETGKVWPMQPEEMPGWLGPIADALDFVNSKHFVHRDVKPENIMFDAEGNAFLGDFGVIKARAESKEGRPETVATGAGLVLGTPHYMAPEVLMGETYDGRADQYSLGVTVFELLAARVPFPGDAPVAIVGHTTRPVPKLTALVPTLSPEVEKVVARSLSKRKEDRYPNCRAFADAFAAAARVAAPKVAVPVGAGRSSPPPPPPPGRIVTPPPVPIGQRAPTPPAIPKRSAPILCPYCGYQANLPDHVRSKAVRCAGCRKVYLLDSPNPNAGTAKQEQAKIETKPDERRVPPRIPEPRVTTPPSVRSREPEPRRPTPASVPTREPEPRRPTPASVPTREPEPRRPTPAKVRTREREREPETPPPPPKPKGPPIWTQPWFRKLVRLGTIWGVVFLLLGAGGFGIYQGVLWYQVRAAKELCKLSDKACDEGRYADSIRHADAALAKDPECAQAFTCRGRAKYFQFDHEGALDDLNQAILLDSNEATGFAYRSAVQTARGLNEEALSDAERAVQLKPDLGVAHAYRGLAKLESGSRGDAEASCNTGVAKSPESPEVYRVRALVLKASGKGSQATDDMQTAVTKSADQAFYFASRAMFQFLPSGASTTLLKVDASFVLGGAPTSAQVDGRNAINKDSSCGLGHLALAAFQARSNKWEEAVTATERAIAASPKMTAAYELAYIVLFNYEKNQTEGLAVLDRGLKEVPTSPQLLFLRGEARLIRAENEGAIADFSDLIRQNPRSVRAYERRAQAYRARGRGDDASLANADERKAADLKSKK